MRDTNIFEDEIAFDKKGVATVSDEVGKQLVAKYPALKAVKASKPKEK